MSKVTESEQKKEDWMNSKWRPMMGWMYMAVCAMDFMVFPILWSVLQSISHGQINSQWQPLTLQGAGLFHIAMGAVLGIAAYGRTKEKMAGAENGGLGGFGPGVGTTYVPPGQGQVNVSNQPGMMNGMNNGMGGFGGNSGFGQPSGFNSQPSSFNSQPSSFNSQPSSFNNNFSAAPAPIGISSSGKKMPPPADEPLL